MAGGFQELLVELFEPVGGVTFRRMFGGLGIFRQGLMFALVADDTLYLKADETLPYGFVVRVLAVLDRVGVEQVGMVTQPEDR